MKSYPTKKLEEICTFQNGLWKAKKEPSKKVAVLRNTNFKNNDGTLNFDDVAEIEVENKQLESRLLEQGDIILERSGGGPDQPVGRVAYFDNGDGEYSFSNFTTGIRPNSNYVYSKYLWLYLLFFYKSGRTEALQKKTTGIRNLIFSEYKQIEIPLPPLETQKKIVAKLDVLLGKIKEAKKLRTEAQESTNNLLSAELNKIFTEGKAKGWEEKEFGEIFTLNYGKGLPKLSRSETGKYSVYGANGELGRSDQYLIEGKGIIVGRKGSAGEVTMVSGKYWPTDVTYYVKEDENYDINFSYYLFKSLNFPQYAIGVKPGINRNKIYGIKISLPSFFEQKKIVAHLDSLSEKVKKIQQAQTATADDLTALEQSILHKAFQGELL